LSAKRVIAGRSPEVNARINIPRDDLIARPSGYAI
jgi:hypothetical protein